MSFRNDFSSHRRVYNGPTLAHPPSFGKLPPPRLALGELSSGRAFDSGCQCFDSCRAAVNELRGRKTHCEYIERERRNR